MSPLPVLSFSTPENPCAVWAFSSGGLSWKTQTDMLRVDVSIQTKNCSVCVYVGVLHHWRP